MVALDADDGRELWRSRVPSPSRPTVWRLRTSGIVGSPSVDGDTLAFGTSDGWLAVLDLGG